MASYKNLNIEVPVQTEEVGEGKERGSFLSVKKSPPRRKAGL